MDRREFITIPAKTLGGVLLYSLAGEPTLADGQQTSFEMPLRFFTGHEAQIVQAACARIFPTDDSGPGATEAGVVIYIDRQLGSPYGTDRYRYTKEPWIHSIPEHGYQDPENPQQVYRSGIQRLGNFVGLSPDEQDKRLEAVEETRFFQLLHAHTVEGMFCDPLHGGNVGLVGWQLIGFPGPVMSYRDVMEKYYGRPYRPEPKSLEQILGHRVKGVEDDR